MDKILSVWHVSDKPLYCYITSAHTVIKQTLPSSHSSFNIKNFQALGCRVDSQHNFASC